MATPADTPETAAATGEGAKAFDASLHLWLEEVEGEQALAWVHGQNERTLGVLQSDPRYQGYYDAALQIATSKARIPYGSIRDGYVYNFWQDTDHERGLWRRTTPESYATANPDWETLLDIDALSAAEGANWVYKGVDCLAPDYTRCLVSLSNGGKDAATVREYDLATRTFVADGFVIPEAKSQELWVDKDTLLIATDWGEENGQATLTTSGYPYVAKLWKRGAPLETAKTMFRGEIGDVAAGPFAIENEFGRRWYGASRAETFFTASNFLFPEDDNGALTGGDPIRLPIPLKSSPQGVFGDMLYLTLEATPRPIRTGRRFRSTSTRCRRPKALTGSIRASLPAPDYTRCSGVAVERRQCRDGARIRSRHPVRQPTVS
ncbi:MAG: hypothetical protein R3C52_11170 [Hyphomonadaceae bacterium]